MKTKTLTTLLAAMLVVCAAGVAAAQTPNKYQTLRQEAVAAREKAMREPSSQLAVEHFKRARAFLLQAQAVRDSYTIQEDIKDVDAMILWYRGRASAENQDYWTAVQLLNEANTKRPELFGLPTEQLYMKDVLDRHLRSMPNRTEIVNLDDPVYILTRAIDDVLWDASAEAKARVVSAFQAAMRSDWAATTAAFQQAVSLAPGNAYAQRFLALSGSQALRASRGLGIPSGDSPIGPMPPIFDLNSLKPHLGFIGAKQIMKALEDILLVLYRNAGK